MLKFRLGGCDDVLKIFFYFLYVTILAPNSSPTLMEIGNQMKNLKIETNSKLIYEDGSI